MLEKLKRKDEFLFLFLSHIFFFDQLKLFGLLQTIGEIKKVFSPQQFVCAAKRMNQWNQLSTSENPEHFSACLFLSEFL